MTTIQKPEAIAAAAQDPKPPHAPAPVTSSDFSLLRIAEALEGIVTALGSPGVSLSTSLPARPATQAERPR